MLQIKHIVDENLKPKKSELVCHGPLSQPFIKFNPKAEIWITVK